MFPNSAPGHTGLLFGARRVFCTILGFGWLMLTLGKWSYSVLPYEHTQTAADTANNPRTARLQPHESRFRRGQAAGSLSRAVLGQNALALLTPFPGPAPGRPETEHTLTACRRGFPGTSILKKEGSLNHSW